MTPEHAAEIFTVVNFSVIGLSHLVQPRVWVEWFALLRTQGYPGAIASAMLSLLVGSIIVALHPGWTGGSYIVTFLGWAQVAKGFSTLVAPSVGMKGLIRVSVERAWEFQFAGALFLVLSAIVAWGWRAA